MNIKIDHIALSVSHLEEEISFYENNFGFRCIDRVVNQSEKLIRCLLEKNGIKLELFCFDDFNPLPPYRKDLNKDIKTLGTKHFAFQVDDIDLVFAELKKKGIDLVTDIEKLENGLRYFFIKDPEGIILEIIESKNYNGEVR
ncbi:MAG: VOC family protein [Candidatus Omnitrophica bacterium]|nr:VOC family protein [Candidatus Omnitrophota bacterium]